MDERLDKTINWQRLNDYVKESLKYEKTGHDYNHTKRVLKIALEIADKCENVDYNILVASCLLHDIANRDGRIPEHNIASGDESETIVKLLGFNDEKALKIKQAIWNHVFREDNIENNLLQIESKILMDSHNIDNLGSIGLIKIAARSLKKELPIFTTKEDSLGDSIYGNIKFLLSMPQRMLTQEGNKIASTRIKILKDFLEGLEKEY